MPAFSASAFAAALVAQLPEAFSGKFCVAFSGGLDSTILLHSLVELRRSYPDWQVRAIHIDHQLQAISPEWAAQCLTFAQALEVELRIEQVTVARDDPQGLEAAARGARYGVFRHALQSGEVLLTAHHADDQIETVLLALLRGAGVPGLAAMPFRKPFACGWHLRPLLTFTRNDLEVWARKRGLVGVDDPSNRTLHHDRNYLRHQVLPALRSRWPALAVNAVRAAGHIGEALALLDELAAADLTSCAIADALEVKALHALSDSRRRNLIRYWLRLRGLPAPSTRKLAGLELDVMQAGADRIPHIKWPGAEVFRHRGLLYARAPQAKIESMEMHWRWRTALQLPAELGRLSLQPTLGPGLAANRLPEQLTIRFRDGGERVRLMNRQHHSSLKKQLQEHSVLPWWRERLPLIYADRTLVAVADVFLTDALTAKAGEDALQIMWEGAPSWRALAPSAVKAGP